MSKEFTLLKSAQDGSVLLLNPDIGGAVLQHCPNTTIRLFVGSKI